jgi:hypothetical protein
MVEAAQHKEAFLIFTESGQVTQELQKEIAGHRALKEFGT